MMNYFNRSLARLICFLLFTVILTPFSALACDIESVRLGGQPGDSYIGPTCNGNATYRTCYYVSGTNLPATIGEYKLAVGGLQVPIAFMTSITAGTQIVLCVSELPHNRTSIEVDVYIDRPFCFYEAIDLYDSPTNCPGGPTLEPAPLSCPAQAPGLCVQAHSTPGCNDCECQSAICDIDSYCCNIEWDGLCALFAGIACDNYCDPRFDDDSDGTSNCDDLCPVDPLKIDPGACGCGNIDLDSDGDGTFDCQDSCPVNSAKTAPGQCGCAVADTDSDGDGNADCNDSCPSDPSKGSAGVCGCGVAEADSDEDGTPDCIDACPADAGKTQSLVCGCGVADTDLNENGILDCLATQELGSAIDSLGSELRKVKALSAVKGKSAKSTQLNLRNSIKALLVEFSSAVILSEPFVVLVNTEASYNELTGPIEPSVLKTLKSRSKNTLKKSRKKALQALGKLRAAIQNN